MSRVKKVISLMVVMVMALMLCAFNANAMETQCIGTPQLKTDFHTHMMSPTMGAIAQQLQFPYGAVSGQDVIDQLPEGTTAVALSDAYIASAFTEMGLLGSADEYEMVKQSNNYAAIQAAKYPSRLVVYASVNPLKDYALDEVKRCHEQLKMPGLKLHFSTNGVDTSNPEHIAKLQPILEYCEDHKMPILIHQRGNAGEYGAANADQVFDIIKDYPRLRVQIAHMGSFGAIMQPTIDYMTEMAKRLKERPLPYVYFDTAALILTSNDEPTMVAALGETTPEEMQTMAELMRKVGLRRILYGTDAPLFPTQPFLDDMLNLFPFNDREFREVLGHTPLNTVFSGIYIGRIPGPTMDGLNALGIYEDTTTQAQTEIVDAAISAGITVDDIKTIINK